MLGQRRLDRSFETIWHADQTRDQPDDAMQRQLGIRVVRSVEDGLRGGDAARRGLGQLLEQRDPVVDQLEFCAGVPLGLAGRGRGLLRTVDGAFSADATLARVRGAQLRRALPLAQVRAGRVCAFELRLQLRDSVARRRQAVATQRLLRSDLLEAATGVVALRLEACAAGLGLAQLSQRLAGAGVRFVERGAVAVEIGGRFRDAGGQRCEQCIDRGIGLISLNPRLGGERTLQLPAALGDQFQPLVGQRDGLFEAQPLLGQFAFV